METTFRVLPALPLDAWENTKHTLHLCLQILGKIRLKMMPRKNHWWYITEYVTAKGISTRDIMYNEGMDNFEIALNFLTHQVEIVSSQGGMKTFSLEEGLSVAKFYQKLMTALSELGIEVAILDKPYDLKPDKDFSEIEEYHHYQKEYVEKFWRILLWVDSVFKEFSGRYYGKTCPVHIYWHHMDLTVTRFSGNKGPALKSEMRISDKDAYTHEVISFGFWAGDEQMREPAFYSYTYPAPDGLEGEPLQPPGANWIDSNGSPMAIITYEAIRTNENPRQALLAFLESAYQAGAKLANWDIAGNTVPDLDEM